MSVAVRHDLLQQRSDLMLTMVSPYSYIFFKSHIVIVSTITACDKKTERVTRRLRVSDRSDPALPLVMRFHRDGDRAQWNRCRIDVDGPKDIVFISGGHIAE